MTAVKDNGEEEASPIVWNGTVYVSTSHETCSQWTESGAPEMGVSL